MGEVMAGKGLSKKKGRASELPLLLQKLVPETLKFPAAESQLILSLSIGTCGLVFRRLHIKNCSDGSTISELEQPRQR